MSQSALVNISVGELIDKITILEIKQALISDPRKLKNIETELAALRQVAGMLNLPDECAALEHDLKQVNQEIWDIEDNVRECERTSQFNAEFVRLARSVYRLNDRRAQIKRQINDLARSLIVEEKSYSAY